MEQKSHKTYWRRINSGIQLMNNAGSYLSKFLVAGTDNYPFLMYTDAAKPIKSCAQCNQRHPSRGPLCPTSLVYKDFWSLWPEVSMLDAFLDASGKEITVAVGNRKYASSFPASH